MNKRKAAVIGIILLALGTLVILPFTVSRSLPQAREREDSQPIAVIELTGAIQEGGGGFLDPGGISPRHVRRQLEQAAEDSSIEGVILRLESPGGSIAASQEIYAIIRDFEKPLVVSMADVAASGGYYISAPAQGIVAQAGTLTGSIGVISTTMNLEGLYEKVGIETETFTTGRHKDMLSRTMTFEERRIMQAISDEAYDQFVRDVAAGRQMEEKEVRSLATGQLYLGSQALELGLVDRLGGLDEAMAYLAEMNDFANPVRQDLPRPSPFFRMLDMGYRALVALEQAALGPELLLLQQLREGMGPDIRYQVR